MFKPKPLHSWVVVLPDILEDGKTPSGIILLKTQNTIQVKTGKVIKVGLGFEGVPPQVKVGEVVMFTKNEGIQFEYEGKIHLLIQEGKLLMVV